MGSIPLILELGASKLEVVSSIPSTGIQLESISIIDIQLEKVIKRVGKTR